MNSRTAILFCVNFAIIHVAYSQSLNRILPNCGLNVLPIAETLGNQLNQLNYLQYDLPYELLPNIYPGAVQPTVLPTIPIPKVLQQFPSVMQTLPNVLQPQPSVLQTLPNVLQQGVPTAVVQDNTVASNLANALQLLVVSNLLRNTLPQARDVVGPYPPVEYVSSSGLRGYNYLY